jgi:hypothetical protein
LFSEGRADAGSVAGRHSSSGASEVTPFWALTSLPYPDHIMRGGPETNN